MFEKNFLILVVFSDPDPDPDLRTPLYEPRFFSQQKILSMDLRNIFCCTLHVLIRNEIETLFVVEKKVAEIPVLKPADYADPYPGSADPYPVLSVKAPEG